MKDPKLVSCEVELKILQAFDKATGRSRNKKNIDLCPDEIGQYFLREMNIKCPDAKNVSYMMTSFFKT